MIISEKQIMDLIYTAHLYLRVLDVADGIPGLISQCGTENKLYISTLLHEVAAQQPSELKNFKELSEINNFKREQ